jgi:lactate dehydrogenase-like 2-hydroxyacid dehydrogenase
LADGAAADTQYLLDTAQFAQMKRGVFIVNTSRGAVIREQALVDALTDGRVGGAGLDVFELEPRIHPLLMQHPKCAAAEWGGPEACD